MSKELINQMFSPELFKQAGHGLIDLLSEHLTTQLSGEGKVLEWREPRIEDQLWNKPIPQTPSCELNEFLSLLKHKILPNSLAIHHPRNMGHQVATPLPIAALCDLVAALTNQAMAVYETGPSATMLERQVLRWLGELIGWNETEGVLTSGGAQANLTALLAARQHSSPTNVWQDGVSTCPPLCILASEHAHYSISRAAGIMGLGTNAVIKIAADSEGRMIISELDRAYQNCVGQGQLVIAVVASAGCTPTGSIDSLRSIGEFCQENKLWLHVDGAHGASCLISKKYRHLLDGIELADSVVWDGHKLLYMPATVSAVLFKNKEASYKAFNQDASYLFNNGAPESESYNISYRTIECTKRMMALKLWTAFSLYGIEGFAALVDKGFTNAKLLASKLTNQADFELLMHPQTNIICFRYLGNHGDVCQASLRTKIIQSGDFHITQVELHGKIWLRTTLMNPYTTEKDLDALLMSIRTQSRALL